MMVMIEGKDDLHRVPGIERKAVVHLEGIVLVHLVELLPHPVVPLLPDHPLLPPFNPLQNPTLLLSKILMKT